jgi:hypothetical protein
MKQHPTKEQWQEIEKSLASLWTGVYLRCDGYLVYACMKRASMTKLAIEVYVDGFIQGAWTSAKDGVFADQAVRFWHPHDQAMHSAKSIKLYEKLYGKRKCKEKGIYNKHRHYLPYWNTPLSFIRHLKKHNEHIEVSDKETHDREVEAKKVQTNAAA